MPKLQPVPTRIARDLNARAADVKDAERALARARNRLDSALYDAVRRRGCQVTAVADAVGLSRETVYKATGRGDPQLSI